MSERPIRYHEQTKWILAEAQFSPDIAADDFNNLVILAIQQFEPKHKDLIGVDFLSPRELEIVRFVSQTHPTNKEIGHRFSITENGAKFILANIKQKIRNLRPSAPVQSRREFFNYLSWIIL